MRNDDVAVKMKQQVHSSVSRVTECFKTPWLTAYHSAVEVPEDHSVSGVWWCRNPASPLSA